MCHPLYKTIPCGAHPIQQVVTLNIARDILSKMNPRQHLEIHRASNYTLEVYSANGDYLGPTDISWLAREIQVG